MQANNAKQAAQQKKDWRGLRQKNPFSYWHVRYTIFVKIKLDVTKSSPSEFEENSPKVLFELYFRCQPVLWRGFVLIASASTHTK